MNAIAIEQRLATADGTEHSRGYQWKSLFLPHGTELRMTSSRHTGYARVVGDNIMYEGASVSPRGLTLAIAGEGRNAWRDLWIKFPNERYWRSANYYRRQAQDAASTAALSPAESMRVAAAAMTQALEAALLLVKQSCHQQPLRPDRRTNRHRRDSDLLGDTCAFD